VLAYFKSFYEHTGPQHEPIQIAVVNLALKVLNVAASVIKEIAYTAVFPALVYNDL
jgi:hypothetical protein